jgi:hypothetical protein
MGERRGAYRVLVGKHEGKRPLERTRNRRRIILKLILKKSGGRACTGLTVNKTLLVDKFFCLQYLHHTAVYSSHIIQLFTAAASYSCLQ